MYIPTIADNDRRDALHSEYVTTSKYEARIPTSQQCKRLTQGVSEALIQREKEEKDGLGQKKWWIACTLPRHSCRHRMHAEVK